MPRLTPRHFALAAVSALALQALPAFDAAAHQQATFTVTIRNVATDRTLELPDGTTTGAPIAPGAYAVVADGTMPFDSGRPAGSNGLEDLAEDGNAEPLIARLKATSGVREAGLFVPGQPFEVMVRPGERLVFVSMFVQSNDLFLAPDPRGLVLFDGKSRPLGGDVTNEVHLWDAGTEVNEQPGTGPNQAPRQPTANTGPVENGVVHIVSDGFRYPAVGEVVQVMLATN